MNQNNQRKMLFLYPEDLVSYSLQDLRSVLRLTSNLNFIANEVNDFVREICEKHLTGNMNCLPKVECLPISDYAKIINEFHNVRICLVKFNNVDYSSCYTEVINNYKQNEQDISHLISLSIDSCSKTTIKWTPDTTNQFDINITTNQNQLKIILCSIMMDIILYRHFNLSHDLSARKNFSLLKRDYIINLNEFNKKRIHKYYGSTSSELSKAKYLSLSYPNVLDYFTNQHTNISQLAYSLVDDYWKLIQNTLFIDLDLDEKYIMFDTGNKYDMLPREIQRQISDVIPTFCKSKKLELPLLLAIRKNSFQTTDCYVIKDINCFLNLKTEFNYYKLEFIK